MKQLDKSDIDLILDAKGEGLSDLPEDALEKDLHLSEILHNLSVSHVSNELVFCGGTALAKAHLAVNRMSEDVDFKYLADPALTKSKTGAALKEVVVEIEKQVQGLGFGTILHAQDSGNFRTIEIQYSSAFPRQTSLRENIKFEITSSSPVLPTSRKPISTFLYLATGHKDFESQLTCLSIEETLIEKVAVFLRKNHPLNYSNHFDATLIRHIYDCDQIKNLVKMDHRVAEAFGETIHGDYLRYRNQFPENEEDSSKFLMESLGEFMSSKDMRGFYYRFVDELVIGPSKDFLDVRESFELIALNLLQKLN